MNLTANYLHQINDENTKSELESYIYDKLQQYSTMQEIIECCDKIHNYVKSGAGTCVVYTDIKNSNTKVN